MKSVLIVITLFWFGFRYGMVILIIIHSTQIVLNLFPYMACLKYSYFSSRGQVSFQFSNLKVQGYLSFLHFSDFHSWSEIVSLAGAIGDVLRVKLVRYINSAYNVSVFKIQTLLFWFLLVSHGSIHVPAGSFGAFYSIVHLHWIPNKILLLIIIKIINLSSTIIPWLHSLCFGDLYSLPCLLDNLESH